jgi:C1A family cysteine protease
MNHFYGYKPDPVDERDFLFAEKPELVPSSIDLRNYCSTVRDQGNLGSCTGFSMTVGLLEFMTLVRGTYKTKFSPMYLYYKEREIEDSIDYDAGAYIRDGLKVLKNNGVARESYWPYVISKFTVKPSARADTNAKIKSHKILSYSRIITLNGIKSALNKKQGVVLGFTVYESFESDECNTTGRMPMPEPNESILGGHAVFCCGYQDDTTWEGGGYLIVKNSWSKDWGDKGYFYMPYAFLNSKDDVSDIWTAVF